MSGLGVLAGKELTESLRTRRLPIVVLFFAALGVLSVLTARYLPEILRATLGEEANTIPIPTPTVTDAIVELQGNIGQLGALTAVVLAMGAMAWERERGTAAFILTKPATRAAFLGAKILALGVVLGLATAVAVAVAWIYAAILFSPQPVVGWVGLGVLAWLALMAWTSITLLASTVLRSAAAAAGIGIVAIVSLAVASAIPAVARVLPFGLDGAGRALATGGEVDVPVLATALVGTLTIIGGSLAVAWLAFRRQEL